MGMTTRKKDSTRAAAEDVREDIENLRTDLNRVVKEVSSLVSRSSNEKARESAARTRAAYQQGRKQASASWDEARDRALSMADTASDEVRRRPFTIMGVTLGVGFLLGTLLGATGARR